jgi:hypothetical protein
LATHWVWLQYESLAHSTSALHEVGHVAAVPSQAYRPQAVTGVPGALGPQVPEALQLSQSLAQAESQQTPSTQKPLAHVVDAVQASPRAPNTGGCGQPVSSELPSAHTVRIWARRPAVEVKEAPTVRRDGLRKYGRQLRPELASWKFKR